MDCLHAVQHMCHVICQYTCKSVEYQEGTVNRGTNDATRAAKLRIGIQYPIRINGVGTTDTTLLRNFFPLWFGPSDIEVGLISLCASVMVTGS
jgi:hypothetical protein